MPEASVGKMVPLGRTPHRPECSRKKEKDQEKKTKKEMRKHQAWSQKFSNPGLARDCHRPCGSMEL